ncbi:ATP-binding cassette domain-containing protein [Allorhodopirellula solitaria]|uniref:Sulfate/thiosulfate import ATP-binding protein CysA n=1 Tax=Allorhodopirellula solitaria TaxID=2527987 RepID=A0A5C5YEK6_9BACT|nr:ABC transporter ATP-binding protein [Allorhodopirellula solitaria]TWT74186.1 Sulfate/thiosulfate import ATP-binding protein CysA [Allorhodopirellula solitaria]
MIRLSEITIEAGDFSLANLSLEIQPREYVVLMGKTGCGKTSLLEILCGLRKPTSGSVWIGGTDVTHYSPGDRQIGYVPQDLALFPTMSVAEHLEFAWKVRGASRKHITAQRERTAEMLAITHLLDRPVHGLSGGEAQRVALGRALALEPAVLLLDEPLSALDEQTRDEMLALLLSVKDATHVTTLHVTHHSGEAARLADRCLRIENGCLVEQ